MRTIPKMKSVMTPFPYSIERDASLGMARRLMMQHDVHHLPVVAHHEPVGMITDRDIKLILGPEFDYPDPKELTVEDAMIDKAYVVDVDTSMITVLDEMYQHRIGSAVITRKGRLAGIFSERDACRELSAWLKREFPDPDVDAA